MHATKIRLFCTKNCLKSSTLSIHCLLLVGLINDVEYDHDMINDVEYDHDINDKTNRKAMNRNWSNQKANPALKPKREINKYYK